MPAEHNGTKFISRLLKPLTFAALIVLVAGCAIVTHSSPDLKRNLDTARPLAEHLGIEVQIIGASKYEVSKTILTKHPGEVVIWVGNSGNLKEIFPFLGGEGAPPTVYDDLFIMKIRDSGSPEVIKKRYGPA